MNRVLPYHYRMNDPILNRLNETYRRTQDTRFTPAGEKVLMGMDLRKSGNRQHSKNVYISTFDPPDYIDPKVLHNGKKIRPGTIEVFPNCELRCTERRGKAVIALYDLKGNRLSREIGADLNQDGYTDEGALTWFSPSEYYGTPWSDNDPAVCQVLTVAGLREFARTWK